MNEALERFHAHKDIFVALGARSDFDLNKLHFALHYRIMIERFGTTDNYNTEYTERLHIPYAKDAFEATNNKDEYAQMTIWVERKEKILKFERLLSMYFDDTPSTTATLSQTPPILKMTKHPSRNAVPFDAIRENYKASMFEHALQHFVLKQQNPTFTYQESENMIPYFALHLD